MRTKNPEVIASTFIPGTQLLRPTIDHVFKRMMQMFRPTDSDPVLGRQIPPTGPTFRGFDPTRQTHWV